MAQSRGIEGLRPANRLSERSGIGRLGTIAKVSARLAVNSARKNARSTSRASREPRPRLPKPLAQGEPSSWSASPPHLSLSSNRATGTASTATGRTQAVSSADKSGSATATSASSSTLSSLARQLSEAAAGAEVRDMSLSYKELGQKAATLLDQIIGDSYHYNQELHDAEVPNTDDPKLLARAEQATDFVNGKGSNPFKGMSRDQLALIAYDDSGTFTVNERRAAYLEAADQEQVWRRKVVAQATDEYNRTGKLTNFFH
ncbi:hypothetical protein ACFS3C_01965 [Azotobacter vinelandii]